MSRGGAVYYYGVDALGTVAAVGNSGGAVQDSYIFDAWGLAKSQTGSLANPFAYTAREWGEAGITLYRTRYYNPEAGRFASVDPLRTEELLDTLTIRLQPPPDYGAYRYVINNPVGFRDPLGLEQTKGFDCTECLFNCVTCCIHDFGRNIRKCSKLLWLAFTGRWIVDHVFRICITNCFTDFPNDAKWPGAPLGSPE
jgi:RHS repeat-associated protein